MNAKNINILLRNNTGNKEKSALIDGFVVRTKPFETIIKEMSSSKTDKPEQSYIIIGQRGSGKTTLLYRLKYAIEDDANLKETLLPIMFSEEQYNLTELENLWENISEILEETYGWLGIKSEVEANINKQFYEERAFETLEQRIKKSGKKIIIFIENVDELFKKIGLEGQKRLREVLLSSNYIRLIASSTTYFDAITDYSKPFYDFFKIIQLGGLSKSECIILLLKIAEQYGEKERIHSIIRSNPSRVESFRRLTGGIPRTMSYLFQIFLDNENGKAIKDLYQLIDDLTFLYKAELDQLSTQQQKVVDVIARNWDAIAVKEIAIKTRYESKQVSSILNALEKNQVVEVVPTKTKNNLYRIRERFLNIYYLMRFGKKQERENVLWLVRFYDAWCNKTELAQYIDKHIKNLADGKYDITAAIDLGNAFFSCGNVSPELKYDLYKKTLSVLPKNFIKDLRFSDQLLYKNINKHVKDKKFDLAIEMLQEIKSHDEKYYMFSSWAYIMNKQYNESAIAAEKLYNLTPTGKIAFRIAYINELFLDNEQKAIEFYKIAFDKGEVEAAQRLGKIYYSINNLSESIKYYLISVESGMETSMIGLSHAYIANGDYKLAEKYIKIAVDKELKGADVSLGMLYQAKSQFLNAEREFKKALDNGDIKALIHLGILQIVRKKHDYELARYYFEGAIQKGLEDGYYFLGKLILDEFDDKHVGIHNLNIALDKGNADAAHLLGHYYQNLKDYKNSDKFFIKSYDLGRKAAILCLVNGVFFQKRKDKKAYALELLRERRGELKKFGSDAEIEYGFMLLLNEHYEESLSVISDNLNNINESLTNKPEEEINEIIGSLTKYLMLLIAKGQYNATYCLFKDDKLLDLKQIVKPIYYALMNYMKDEFPLEYLKAGDELKETVTEIIGAIERYKKDYI